MSHHKKRRPVTFIELVDALAWAIADDARNKDSLGEKQETKLRAELNLRLAKLKELLLDDPWVAELEEKLKSYLANHFICSGASTPSQHDYRGAIRQRDRDLEALRTLSAQMAPILLNRGNTHIIEGRGWGDSRDKS